MNIDSIQTGIVIDHITAGKGMEIYHLLQLDKLDCSVALLMNASSNKMGKKDIIKVNADIDIDMNALGYVDPGATVVMIRDSKVVEKRTLSLPKKLTNVLMCKNPRCITTTEQELPHVFLLTEPKNRVYRCLYCETKANNK
ncbi:MAG: aspartate carbamoyltransferase regulatory subunit [Oscillospiraceae bacterium]|nr:aspartate carbamoyltransferase regulatory subunit [Oscillospiraceae bacterium]